MRFALLFFFFLFAEAQAARCTKEVRELFLKEQSFYAPIKLKQNHYRWSALEKEMIFAAVKADGHQPAGMTREEALHLFGDFDQWSNGKPGPLAGQIAYFKVNEKVITKVVYYPGDNEYGAIFELVGTKKFKMVARVQDGEITCR